MEPVDTHDSRAAFMQRWLDAVNPKSTGYVDGGADGENADNENGFAARLYSLCLHGLQTLCCQERVDCHLGAQPYLLRQELGKLYLWGEGFGHGELDKALEQSDDLRESVVDLLCSIGKLLLRELQPSAPAVNGGHVQELERAVNQARLITSGDLDDSEPESRDDAYDTDNEDETDEDKGNICEVVAFSTKCLAELGPVLEQNLVRAAKAHTATSSLAPVVFSLSDPAEIYVSLVREKFEEAPKQLVERLGEANWQRHVSVRKRMDEIKNNPAAEPAPADELRIATSIFRPVSTFHDSGIGTSVPAQTHYAASHMSFQSSNTEDASGSLRVPATPTEVIAGKRFKCYICGVFLSTLKSRVDWKMHVFADLKPYICTFADCNDKLAQFPSRAAWANHEFAKHRIHEAWRCPECPEECTSPSVWEAHLQQLHQRVFCGSNLRVAKDMAYTTHAKPIEKEQCPLCQQVIVKPRRAFISHVGRHMEEIALMALPQDDTEDSDTSSVGTAQEPSHQGSVPLDTDKQKQFGWNRVGPLPRISGKTKHDLHLCHFQDCERAANDKGFPRRWDLLDHLTRVHDYDLFSESDSPSPSLLEDQTERPPSISIFEDEDCDWVPARGPKCLYCSTLSSREIDSESFDLIHRDKQLHHCEVCEDHFRDSSDRERHAILHTGASLYPCLQCGQLFPRRDALAKHQRGHRPCASTNNLKKGEEHEPVTKVDDDNNSKDWHDGESSDHDEAEGNGKASPKDKDGTVDETVDGGEAEAVTKLDNDNNWEDGPNLGIFEHKDRLDSFDIEAYLWGRD